MKIKMFGKKSVSALLFWIVVICLVGVLIKLFDYIPRLIKMDSSLIWVSLQPLIGYLSLLIPLALLFYNFQKRTIFTQETIKYLYLFAICNFLATLYYLITSTYIVDIEFLEAFFLSFSNILLIIFALILAAVFKEGFTIQTENDLTV